MKGFLKKFVIIFCLVAMNAFCTVSNKFSYKKEDFSLLINDDQISNQIQITAKKLNEVYKDKDLLVVVILKGAVCFAVDLVRLLDDPVSMEFIKCKSYNGRNRGALSIAGVESLSMKGKHVLVVDDIFDSGNTMTQVMKKLRKKNPASLKSIVLLKKLAPRVPNVILPDYQVFEIDNKFIVGYGLDYDENLRGLQGIYYLRNIR